jgi:two-component system phosphate regulon response regulator OmpR
VIRSNLPVSEKNFTVFSKGFYPVWQPHILVVDDDRRLRELLRDYLAREGYLVTSAPNADDAAAKLDTVQFDLLVLDVMMPGMDGMAFTRQLRGMRAHQKLPILLLTARGESSDRIAGLEAGSDDYLAKPFEPRELALRVQAILRRQPAQDMEKHLQLGRWLYDREREELRDGTETMRLSPVEAGLLKLFCASPGEAISREEILARAGGAINDRSIDVQVTRLRRKIEPDPKQPRYLVTVRGEGYMLLPEREKTA